MLRSALRVFFASLFFVIFFFYQKNVFAADYFFDDFNGTSIDSTKWDINNLTGGKRWCADELNNLYISGVWFDVATGSCHGTVDSLPLGNVDVANGEVTFSSPVSRAFPYMSSGPPNNFIFPPTGDFAFEIRLKFNSVTLHGTGAVALYWGDTTTLGNNPPKGPDEGLFAIWNDGHTQVRAVLLGQNAFLGTTFDYHKYRLEYRGGKYSVFFDDRLVVGPSSSSVRPTATLIGNPAFAFWNPWDWSDFSIDYVKVEKIDVAPEPFLDLPWDYEEKGFEFKDVVFNPKAWFDHEYPLQNFCCNSPVLTYTGELKNEFYRSHSGYDYSSQNGVVLGTHVLAAASGWATFKPEKDSGGAGNIIKIDHENGYQTWYEHLAIDNLIISTTSGKVFVNQRQKIGEVGMTGNTTGPHIHLSVFKDANENNSFDDDYPWGLTDPLEWEGKDIDPWTQWTSDPPEKEDKRYGVESYNLFAQRSQPKQEEIPTTGGSVSLGDILIDIINGTFNQTIKFIADYGPYESTADGKIKSIMPSIFLNAFDSLGEKVTEFLEPATITYNYADADLLNIDENSLKIYWFNEATGQWEGLPSIVDKINKTVTSETDHFSQFALMGEVKDLIPPVTDVIVFGDKGEDNRYRSDIDIKLQGQDNEGGVGLLYTLYTLNGSDWFEYEDPIIFTDEGVHSLTYQSFDKADNKEERKTITFSIDKTPPETEIFYSLPTKNIQFEGKDNSGSTTVTRTNVGKKQKIVITDKAGNTLALTGSNKEKGKNAKIAIESLQYNDNQPIDIDPTTLSVTYKLNENKLDIRKLTQTFVVKGEMRVKLVYSEKTRTTRVITKVKGQEKIKEELDGMRLLKISSDNGTLKYSY